MSGLIDTVIVDLEALHAGNLDKSIFTVWRDGKTLPNGLLALGYLTYTDRFDQLWEALNEAAFRQMRGLTT